MLEREFKRYAAYFRGWCQAFGEHERLHGLDSGIDWLIAGHQVGLVLPAPLVKRLRREVLLRKQTPTLVFNDHGARVGELEIAVERQITRPALEALEGVFRLDTQLHLYLCSHLLYGQGNRIITFSSRKPVAIIYKEIGSMRVRLDG